MNRTHLWKLLFIVFVVCWAVFEGTPPTNGDLLAHFETRAVEKDGLFNGILEQARGTLASETNKTAYAALQLAVGTNDIAKYFPHITDAATKKNPSQHVLNRLQKEIAGKLRLGLDLQGGASFLVEMDWDPEDASTNEVVRAEEKSTALANAIEVLRKRVDSLGVSEPSLEASGSDRITIQLPGLDQATLDQARELIETAAFLEFRLVHSNSVQYLSQNLIPPGYEVLEQEMKQKDGTTALVPMLVETKTRLTGKYLTSAFVSRAELTNEPEILFRLNSEGAALFATLTRNNVGQRLAIVLDGELYSAPNINSPIEGGSGVIQGQFDLAEAITLANVLQNPLEAPVRIVQETSVGASLGSDSIRSGFKATLIGLLAVAGFMLVYYMFAGAVANVALSLNIVILLGVLCSLEATLTLPGIAGILLTVGMAVDSNVLIFERIREELKSGKTLRGALAAGYNKAFGTILDSNVTTLISAIILIAMGTGPVKGFGYTLTIGICTSVFTALVVTRLIFDWGIAKGWIRSIRMLELIKQPKIDYLKYAKPAFAVSWLLILGGIAYGFSRGADAVSYEFLGGDKQSLTFAQKVDQKDLTSALDSLNIGNTRVQYVRDISSGRETLSLTTRAASVGESNAVNHANQVLAELTARYPEAKFERLSLDSVGPTVGAEILKTAVVAMLLALFGILVYVAFRFELSFAVATVVAIFHDVLMTLGWFFLTGRELSSPMVAAILTIIGFSVNDTIVIFDRIREDLKLGVRGTFAEVINRAISKTLSRTIITSGTTLIAALALFIFGGGVINDFAFTFIVGILTGTYSTIYIATAMVLWWHKGERPKTGSQVIMESSAASARAQQPA